MSKFVLKLAYDGTDYIGWQRQIKKHGVSIQAVVEDALAQVLSERVTIHASGRTDAGVHALGQVAHFSSDRPIPPDSLRRALNHILPLAVRVTAADLADDDFHARYSAHRKTYRYQIARPQGQVQLPFEARYSWAYDGKLDPEAMREAGRLLVGRHDFVRFCATGSSALTTTRTIYRLDIEEPQLSGLSDPLTITISGNGFLYKMVRIITARLVAVGAGKLTAADIASLLEGTQGYLPAVPAPSRGLFLLDVQY